MNDYSIMPWGKYAGKRLIDIPAHYLLWLHDQGVQHEGLKRYILDNYELLLKEAGRKK